MKDGSKINLELDVRNAMLGVFLIGIIVGLTAGVVGASMNIQEIWKPNFETVNISEIDTTGEPVMGESDADVTLYIYEDFQCPFCQRFEQESIPEIEREYVESGDVRIVWKDFPLTRIHPWAKDAAVAMECVHMEGGDQAFWSVKDRVFENQGMIDNDNVNEMISGWATEEGVPESEVRSCIESGDAIEEVEGDLAEGRSLGGSGTPTVFVSGDGSKALKVVGAQPFSQFRLAIEKESGR